MNFFKSVETLYVPYKQFTNNSEVSLPWLKEQHSLEMDCFCALIHTAEYILHVVSKRADK